MDIKAKEIKIVDINSLTPNPKNPNKHPEEQIARLCKILKHQGFRNPIVVSKRSGFVIAGHGRLLAAKTLGFKDVPVIFEEFENEAAEYQHMVADNAIADWADLNLEAIKLESIELKMDDLELFGLKQNLTTETEEKGDKGVVKNLSEFNDNYDPMNIKQIVLVFTDEEFIESMELLKRVKEDFKVDNNTQAVLSVLRNYANN